MQTIEREQEWKNIHKRALLNESFVEVSLDITDPDALADAEAEDNGAIYTSDSKELTKQVDKNISPYCTLEQNLWCLDGSRKAIPETNFKDDSYASDVLSDDTCVFSTKRPTITIEFDEVHRKLVPGVTITWSKTYNEYADTFEVIAYNGDTVVATKEVTGNRYVKSLIPFDIVNYKRVVVIIKKWCLPHHRARVEQIFIGLNKVYGKADLFDYSHSQSVDPVSTSLPKVEISFSIDNVNGEYNPHNPYGLAQYLMERQEIKARYGLKMDDGSIEWIKGGTFYLSEWYAKQNGMTADFKARDILEFMSDIYAEGHDFSSRKLSELATKLFVAANLPLNSDGSRKWRIDSSLDNIKTNARLPEDTLANNLQLIANAAGCVLYQDRDGTIRIEPLSGGEENTDYEINAFNSYSKSEITLSKPIKQVRVKVYKYEIVAGDVVTTMSEAVHPTDANVVGVMGETIMLDNPLVTSECNPAKLAELLYTYLGHRMTLESSWRPDVRLDALDIVKNVNDYNTRRVRMTDVEFKYNGAFRCTGKGKVI